MNRFRIFIPAMILVLPASGFAKSLADCSTIARSYGHGKGPSYIPSDCAEIFRQAAGPAARQKSEDGLCSVSGVGQVVVVEFSQPQTDPMVVHAPVREFIAGSNTTLQDVRGVALDARGKRVVVLDAATGRLHIFSLEFPGNVPPLKTTEAASLKAAVRISIDFARREIHAFDASNALVLSTPYSLNE